MLPTNTATVMEAIPNKTQGVGFTT